MPKLQWHALDQSLFMLWISQSHSNMNSFVRVEVDKSASTHENTVI